MNHPIRSLILLLMFSCTLAWVQPALAARLASIEGQADAEEKQDEAEFKLSEEINIDVIYNVIKRADDCSVTIRVFREHNGRWHVVNTVLSTSTSSRGSSRLTLPAGSYKIEIVANHARYTVSVDN